MILIKRKTYKNSLKNDLNSVQSSLSIARRLAWDNWHTGMTDVDVISHEGNKPLGKGVLVILEKDFYDDSLLSIFVM